MSYSRETVQLLKQQVNIVDVIGRAIPLQKKGPRYTAICPFHKEKTASFSVNEDQQFYYCFGCHEKGDVISFVEKYYNLDFTDAVERIASENGIKLEKGNTDKKRELYYRINQDAARFFYKSFTEGPNKGYAYMKRRGINPETLKKFGIGYADESWDSLYQHLKSLGYQEQDMIKIGLISENKGKYYDRFRNRVIFPIINTGGNVIGFGGRALSSDESAKYLNSPESDIFKKKNNLYGLNLTRRAVSKSGFIILVEGYMDVIGLYQAGIENVGASLGTALTIEQANIIKRYAKKVVLSYDSDNAGIEAALRGMDILNEAECSVRIMHVTDGKDPDEYIKKEGKQSFLQLVENAKSPGEYLIQHEFSKLNMEDLQDRLDSINVAARILLRLKSTEREIYAEMISKDYNLSKVAILEEMNRILAKNNARNNTGPRPKAKEEESKEEVSLLEADIIKLATQNEGYIPKVKEYPELFRSIISKNIFDAISKDAEKNNLLDINRVLDGLGDNEKHALLEIIDKIVISGDEEEVFQDCLRRMRLDKLLSESEMIDGILITEEYDEAEITSLMQRKKELQELINKERVRTHIDGKES